MGAIDPGVQFVNRFILTGPHIYYSPQADNRAAKRVVGKAARPDTWDCPFQLAANLAHLASRLRRKEPLLHKETAPCLHDAVVLLTASVLPLLVSCVSLPSSFPHPLSQSALLVSAHRFREQSAHVAQTTTDARRWRYDTSREHRDDRDDT